MAAPKSNMKINRDGITFEESIDRANYYISELTRAAYRDIARLILYETRKKVRNINNYTKHMRWGPKRYDKWIRKVEHNGKLTNELELILGVEPLNKGAVTAWWADQSELGTAGQPKRGFLTQTVTENIDKIREIEAQYLSGVTTEDESAIDEKEVMPGDDLGGEDE